MVRFSDFAPAEVRVAKAVIKHFHADDSRADDVPGLARNGDVLAALASSNRAAWTSSELTRVSPPP